MGKIRWSVKKSLALSLAFFCLVFIGLCFVPMFACYDATNTLFYGSVIQSFLSPEKDTSIGLPIAGFSVAVLLILVGFVFFLRSVFSSEGVGDAEDKFFVFGDFFMTLGSAVFTIFCFSSHHNWAIFLGLLGILSGIVSIIVHYKKLSYL